MEHVFTYRTVIDSRDVDGRARCRPSALLGHLQEAATAAAAAAGHGRTVLLERYGVVWVMARSGFELFRPLRWEEELTVTTWHRGLRLGSVYRDYDLFVGDEPVGRAISLWALVEAEQRRILKLAHVPEFSESAAPRPDRREQLSRLRAPEGLSEVERRAMRYSDTDINGHVNNVRYADFVCDAIHAEQLPPEQFVAAMQINYTAECRPGEIITLAAAAQGDERFVCGTDAEGREHFCAQLRLDKEPRETVK